MTPTADPPVSEDPWSEHAQWWVREFTDGIDSEYRDQMLPLVAAHLPTARPCRVVDLGCGEGQVARMVAQRGCEVVGVDASAEMLDVARERGGGVRYVEGSVLDVPLASASVDAAVSCLVLEHVEDFEAAYDEVARVVRPGGRLLLLLNHPVLQPPGSGWIHDHVADPPEQYWRLGPYLTEGAAPQLVATDISVVFHYRPLSRYLNAAHDRGLRLVHMAEPRPPADLYSVEELDAGADLIPRLLFLALERF